MIYTCSFSTGLSSAVMTDRVIDWHGPQSVRVVFMNTKIEAVDNYRFQSEMYQRWLAAGVPKNNFTFLEEGRDPYQVATDENMIFNQRRHPCTRILKIEPFMNWLKQCDPTTVSVCIGIDFSEVDRKAAIIRNYKKAGYRATFPLLWKPIEYRPYEEIARHEWGIEPPKMYGLGYSHANCGGRCFAQGIGDWIRTLINDRAGFLETEQWERDMRKRPGLENYAICRDQSNGEVKPRTLEEIRLDYEAKPAQLPIFSSQVNCVRCGVGDFISD